MGLLHVRHDARIARRGGADRGALRKKEKRNKFWRLHAIFQSRAPRTNLPPPPSLSARSDELRLC
jgi:hypothetical protein